VIQLDLLAALEEIEQPTPAWRLKHSLGPRPAHIRFWEKVSTREPGKCWLWLASCVEGGYGQFQIGHAKIRAHRWAYEREFGPVPAGKVLDHLCRVRNCVNPAHLEPVTTRINILRGEAPTAVNARKDECEYGHPFNIANTYRRKNGNRRCRRCHAIGMQRRRGRPPTPHAPGGLLRLAA
jgi:hypothetical protein